MIGQSFPLTRAQMEARGDYYCDFLLVTGDAFVDHPSFGLAIIARVLEDEGFRVAILAQPAFHTEADFVSMGRPRFATMVTGGNIDSMVAHYTAAKRRRSDDAYSPAGKAGKRPDRAASVYARLARRAFPDVPIILGGLEASLRRFAHYDYWADRVLPSILEDSGADLIVYGMGEKTTRELARRLAKKQRIPTLCRDLRGVCYFADEDGDLPFAAVSCPTYEEVCSDKRAYARAALLQETEQDAFWGKAVIQPHGTRWLIQNPPSRPLSTPEMDAVYALPFSRRPHEDYGDRGVPAAKEVQFSIAHNRGCFGACHFCALSFHQGRYVSARSHASVIEEAEKMTEDPAFKGYIHDVGGPTANFRRPSCEKQKTQGLCRDKKCLTPTPCPVLDADHGDYLSLLQKLRALPKVKKVFIRSGIRYDYLLEDSSSKALEEIVRYHVSGQLKVAPEHCSANTLDAMGKPAFRVYEAFRSRFAKANEKAGLRQFLVPYFMSSHPGCTLRDAVKLAEYLNAAGAMPEQVQDFYPTPGTLSTAMYHTELDPRTMEPICVAKAKEEKAMQRALLQWRRPEKRGLVEKALRLAGREDLIGYGKHCLIHPRPGSKPPPAGASATAGKGREKRSGGSRSASTAKPPGRKKRSPEGASGGSRKPKRPGG